MQQQLFFIAAPCFSLPKQSRRQLSTRRPYYANINETRDQAREDEIAAKIANLRKQKRLQSQKTPNSGSSEKAETIRSFQDLPDWKKEEVLQTQIEEAEAFLNPRRKPDESSAEGYKPKVSTWGVYPRPDNISRTYGGGKNIKPGGVDLNSPDAEKRDEAVAEKLAAYRASRGIDTEREERHRDEIEAALAKAAEQMSRSLPYEAIRTLQSVEQYISDQSRLGGQVFLSLALAMEAVGKREEAKQLYIRLRRNPFPEISTKAKQLLQGFAAMDMLQIEDETSTQGFRVTNFNLPDLTTGIEKRYETAPSAKAQRATPVSAQTTFLLALLILSPLALILFLRH